MMREKNWTITKEESLDELAEEILKLSEPLKVFLFYGNLGAGKTTLIKKLCYKLGVTNNLSSPSFSLINEYENSRKEKFYHMDLYRMNNPRELLDIGFEDYLYSSNYCFIEWPEIAKNYFNENIVEISMKIKNNNSREIKFNRF